MSETNPVASINDNLPQPAILSVDDFPVEANSGFGAHQHQKASRFSGLVGRLRGMGKDMLDVQPTDAPTLLLDRRDPSIPRLGYGEAGLDASGKYLSTMFPNEDLTLFSNEGSSAILYEDGKNRVYKVSRQAGYYSYQKDEMAALTLLHNEGIAPKPYALIEPAEKFRGDLYRSPKKYFVDVPIITVDGGGAFPVIVMEKIDTAPVEDSLTDEQLIEEFDRVLAVGQKHNLSFGDVEFVTNKSTGHVVIVDAGGMSKQTGNDKYVYSRTDEIERDDHPTLTEEDIVEASMVSSILGNFTHRWVSPEVAHELITQGPDAVHQALIELMNSLRAKQRSA